MTAGITGKAARELRRRGVDSARVVAYFSAVRGSMVTQMKISNSLKTLKKRHKQCRVVRRRGRVYVINKTNPRFKARQG